jgi:acyl carrier protein
MTRDEIRTAVIQALSRIAPEFDPRNLQPDAVLRQELDLDSMDFLNFVIGLHDSVGITVPEQDYAKLSTLNSAIDYLAARVTA